MVSAISLDLQVIHIFFLSEYNAIRDIVKVINKGFQPFFALNEVMDNKKHP
jgi:hypothetical protein